MCVCVKYGKPGCIKSFRKAPSPTHKTTLSTEGFTTIPLFCQRAGVRAAEADLRSYIETFPAVGQKCVIQDNFNPARIIVSDEYPYNCRLSMEYSWYYLDIMNHSMGTYCKTSHLLGSVEQNTSVSRYTHWLHAQNINCSL